MNDITPEALGTGQTTKRFIVFASDSYYPGCGLRDAVLTTDDYGAVNRLLRILQSKGPSSFGGVAQGEFQVFDCERRMLVQLGKSQRSVNDAMAEFLGASS